MYVTKNLLPFKSTLAGPPLPIFSRSKSWPEHDAFLINKDVCKLSTCGDVHRVNFQESMNQQESTPSRSKGWKSKIRKLRNTLKYKDSYVDDSKITITNKEKITNKCVHFGKVAVREHARILGDHPACQDGLALGLDWKHTERTTVMELDLYERWRNREGRRGAYEMRKLSAHERAELLRIAGVDTALLRRSHMSSEKGSARAA